MNLGQRVTFNTLVQIISKIVTLVFGLLTTILLTSYLGVAGYGRYIYVITLAIVFGSLADWGTLSIGIRETAKNPKNTGRLLANITFIRWLMSLLAGLLLIIFAFGQPNSRTIIGLGALIVFWTTTKASFSLIFQARLQMYKTALVDITVSSLTFIFSWWVIHQQLGLGPLIWSVIWASFFGCLVAGYLALKTVHFDWQIDRVLIKDFLSESLPMGAILLMFTVDNKIDTVMLGLIKGSQPVGIYGLSYRIYDVLILGAAYLMNAFLPVISQYQDLIKFKNTVRKLYQKAFDLLLGGGLLVVIVVLLISPWLIQLLTQQRINEFLDSINLLRILSLAMFIAYFNHLTGYTIVALGKQRPYFWVALVALIFNVLMNLVVIPRFSYWGAAWVTVITEGGVLAITSWFIFRLLGIIPSFSQFPQTLRRLFQKRGKIF